MKNLLAADFEHGISSLAWWLVGGRRGAAEGGRRSAAEGGRRGARLWIGATACEATQEGRGGQVDRPHATDWDGTGGFLMPGTGPTKKIKTCGPLVFNLQSPNANLLEYTFFFTWHLGFRLDKSRNLPSELCKLVGDALSYF